MTVEPESTGFGPSASTLPSSSVWTSATKLEVLNQDGSKVKLASLLAPDAETDTVLIIFIRHFFCGLCQDYIRSLSPLITSATLKARRMRCIIVGCGSINLIESYLEATGTEFPIYSDPTRVVYKTLEMTRTLHQPTKKPDYVRTGVWEMTYKALQHGVRNVMKGKGLWEAGDISQVGGEWLVKDGKVEWCHRMVHTTDHMTVENLWEVITCKDEKKPQTNGGVVPAIASGMEVHTDTSLLPASVPESTMA